MLALKDAKRYFIWAKAVMSGKLREEDVQKWLSLSDFKEWRKDYLGTALQLKDVKSIYANLTKDLATLKMSQEKIKAYVGFLGTFAGRPFMRLLDAAFQNKPEKQFGALIEQEKKTMSTMPKIIQPLIQKNITKHEEMRDDYLALQKKVNDSLEVIGSYNGLQLLELLGIL